MPEDKSFWRKLRELTNLKLNDEEEVETEAELQEEEAEEVEETQVTSEAETSTTTNSKTEKKEPKVAANQDDDAAWFKNFVKEIGGREAFKGFMLNSVEATDFVNEFKKNQKAEKDVLVANIVANSSQFTEDELGKMELPFLKKMADAIVPEQFVTNYSGLGAGMKENSIAEMPDIFSQETWKKEA